MNRSDGRIPKGYLRIAIALTIVILLFVAFQYGGLGIARRAGLIATPEHLTELYFSNPNTLPTKITGNKRVDVFFTIVNREGGRRVYDWSADFLQGQTKISIANGSTTLANLDSQQIALDLPGPVVAGSGTVEVKLVAPNQSIDFHLNILPSHARPTGRTG